MVGSLADITDLMATIEAARQPEPTDRAEDAASGREEITTHHRHTHHVFSVAVSPSGETVARASVDATVRLWNAAP